MKRPMTADERQRKSECMRQAWAEGKFANCPKGVMWDAWLPPHDALLRELEGQYTIAELAVIITERFGVPRTETAVEVRQKRLGLCRVVDALTARQMGRLFGVDPKTITHSWIKNEWLSGDRVHDMPAASWIFRPSHIEAFIRSHPEIYDWTHMQPGRWRSLAEMVYRTDPLLSLPEAARALRASPNVLSQYCRRGWMPSLRRPSKTGAQAGHILIRRSDLGKFYYRRPELVGHRGRGSKVAA